MTFCGTPFLLRPFSNAPRKKKKNEQLSKNGNCRIGRKNKNHADICKTQDQDPRSGTQDPGFLRSRRPRKKIERKMCRARETLNICFSDNPTISILSKVAHFFSFCEARSKMASKKDRATKLHVLKNAFLLRFVNVFVAFELRFLSDL